MAGKSRRLYFLVAAVGGSLALGLSPAMADKIKLRDEREFEGKIDRENQESIEMTTVILGARTVLKFKREDVREVIRENLPEDFFGKEKTDETHGAIFDAFEQEKIKTDDDLRAYIKANKNTINLKVASKRITDVGLKEVKALKGLQLLELGSIHISDSGLKELKGLESLKSLSLSSPLITDACADILKAHTSLEAVSLESAPITDAGVKGLQSLPRLRRLGLRNAQITDAGLNDLTGATKLDQFVFSSPFVTDPGVAEFKRRMTEVKVVRIPYTGIPLPAPGSAGSLIPQTDEALKAFVEANKDNQNLKSLTLDSIQITDGGFKELKKLKTLQQVSVSSPHISDDAFKELRDLPALQRLTVKSPRVTNASLLEINRFTSLRHLMLASWEITDEGLKQLHHDGLQSLDLSSDEVTDAGLKELGRLKSLNALRLGSSLITDAGAGGLKQLKGLRRITLDSDQITDSAIKELGGFDAIQALSFRSNNITDAGLKGIQSLKSLKTVNFYSRQITDDGVRALASIQSIENLSVGSPMLTDESLKYAVELKSLGNLGIWSNKITNAGIMQLKTCKSLRSAYISSSQVTLSGLQELRKECPSSTINGWTFAQAPAVVEPTATAPASDRGQAMKKEPGASLPHQGGPAVVSSVPGTKDATTAKLNENSTDLVFDKFRFSTAADYARRSAGVNMVVDWAGLRSVGVDPSTPVTANLRNRKISDVLDHLVNKSGRGTAKWRVDDEGIVLISSPAAISAMANARVEIPADIPADLPAKAALQQTLGKVDLQSFRLSTTLDYLSRVSGVVIEPRWDSLQAIGVEKDQPVTLQCEGVSAGRMIGLTVWMATSRRGIARLDPRGVVIVDAVDAADKAVAPGGQEPGKEKPGNTGNESALGGTGPGGAPQPGAVAGKEPLPGAPKQPGSTGASRVPNTKDAAMARLKESPVPLEIKSEKFSTVVDYARRQSGTNMVVDWVGLRSTGVDPATLVGPNTPNAAKSKVSIRKVSELLNHLVRKYGEGTADWCVDEEGVVLISSFAALPAMTSARVQPAPGIPADLPANAALQAPIQGEMQNLKFELALKHLSKASGIEIQARWDSLTTIGIDKDRPVTLSFEGVPAARAIGLTVWLATAGRGVARLDPKDGGTIIVEASDLATKVNAR